MQAERGVQHLGLEVAFSTAFRSAERGDLAGGGIGRSRQPYGERTCGQRGSPGSAAGDLGVTRRKWHGGVPSPWAHRAARSCLRRGRAGCCRPQLRCPSLPTIIYSQARSAAPPTPLTAAAAPAMGRWKGATPCPNRGNTLQGMGEWGQFQPGLLQSPLSRISPLAEACSQLAAKQAPSSPQNPFPSCDLGVLGSPHHHHAKLCCPCSWDPAPERAASPGWRSSAREESTCFQAQGNWSTLSFRCL